MIAELTQPSVVPVHQALSQRATQLDLSCWCMDVTLEITKAPLSGDDVFIEEIVDAAKSCRDKNSSVIVRGKNPFDLLAMPDDNGATVIGLPRDQTTRDRNRLIQILKNYHTDLNRSAQDSRAIDGFNVQLSQSYEEVNLIFRMSKFLSAGNNPLAAARSMCDELRDVIGYRWVALLFDSCDLVLPVLRGSMIHSGELPCSEENLRINALSIPRTAAGQVLVPEGNALAACAGSEVLCKRLMHGTNPIGLLVTGNRVGVDPDISSNEIQLVEATTGFLELFHQNAFRFSEQRQQFFGTLHALTAAVDAKDPYTAGHSERVGLLASQLAAGLGLDSETVEATRVAGLLHDIGKIGVPESILTKPSKLTDDEFAIVKRHPVIGHKILSQLPSLSFQLPGVLHHHERWDGGGYPHQLKGEQIPRVARMLAFADTFDAMSSNRAYRSAMSRTRVLDEIQKSSGLQFDPQMVEKFLALDFGPFDILLENSGVLQRLQPGK